MFELVPLWWVMIFAFSAAVLGGLAAWVVIQYQGLAIRLAQESGRLDWLDKRCSPVIEGQTYSWPYGEHVANAWRVEWPASNVREAIDSYRQNETA